MPLPEGPENPTCVCGSTHWHKMVEAKLLWCQRCGSIRAMFQNAWKIPLDRVGDLARSVPSDEEPPTQPGTPKSKSGLIRAAQAAPVPPRKDEK